MSRIPSSLRQLMIGIAALAMSGIAAGPTLAQSIDASPAPSQRPNVIIVLADDMGYNDVGYHGSKIATPTIDRLAAAGATLTQFYAQPTCSPTRASLMTGKSAVELGILMPLAKISTKGLPQSETLMPQYFQKAGYQTALVGKWHLGHATKAMTPNARGFDHFYGYLTGGVGHYDHVHGGGYDWQRNGTTVREEGYTTHLLTDEAVRVIQSRDQAKPMFLYLSYAAPHLPNEAPAETIAEYEGRFASAHRQRHAAMVTELDRGFARVIAALEDADMLDNTLIWFMSDNGGLIPMTAEDNAALGIIDFAKRIFGTPIPFKILEFVRLNAEHAGSDNTPFRQGKMSVYEGGVHVPSFVYWPDKLSSRKVAGRITVQDVLPTLADAVSLPHAPFTDLSGQVRWGVINGTAPTPAPDYFIHGLDGEAYYEGDWKLVVLNNGTAELYNLAVDPTEQTDVRGQHPQIAKRLLEKIGAAPRGELVNPPIWKTVFDTDFFGGEEDRQPWADVVQD